jgi:hypothetical protein
VLYRVEAKVAVCYLDLELNERGIKTVYKTCMGAVDAVDEADAKEKVRHAA